MIKLSYAITVSSEVEEPINLIKLLSMYKQSQDELCVLLDKPKVHHWTLDQLYIHSSNNIITLKESAFNNDFARWKNELNRMCSGDYIFNIDADEMPSEQLLLNIHELIELNPLAKVFAVPRVNTVEGLTQEDIQKWGWRVDDKSRINWPDWQTRIYKNDHGIYWEGKVHERINIWQDSWPLPIDSEYFVLYHHKQIERQRKQNDFYNNI
jgi:hypothetical protein